MRPILEALLVAAVVVAGGWACYRILSAEPPIHATQRKEAPDAPRT